VATSGNSGDPARPTPPPLFLLLDLPFGAAVGYVMIAVPWWLRQAGLPLDQIAALSAVAFAPHALKIAWIPLLDVFGTKKGWYLAMCGASAALLVAASLVPDPARNLGLYTLLLALLQATATTAHAANNALMAITTRMGDKGKVGGYSMASNVGGTNVLGALAVPIAQHLSPRAAGIALAVAVLASASAALRIAEPRLATAAGTAAGGALRASAAGCGRWAPTCGARCAAARASPGSSSASSRSAPAPSPTSSPRWRRITGPARAPWRS
jgi:hypothetical protein